MAERQLGPFVLSQKLGGGGMGVVYRAKYTKTGQDVALKLLPAGMADDPKLVARFNRELDILKKLRHPNIVPCFGGGTVGNQRFFAMELVEGGSLSAEIKRRGRIPWEGAIAYGEQICAALEHAHEHGIIHRDLKPANLLVGKDGKLKLADFGIARDSDATALTATGRTVGTYAYMAPEQIRGEPPVSHKADLYALGCVLFEMLTGKPPFEAETAPEVLYMHLDKQPPRVASINLDCPIWLDTLVSQLLEKDPEKRPRDAGMVALALREVADKVTAQVSMSQHAVSGGPTAIGVTTDITQVKKLLKGKKKKKSETGPFYEKSWFLGLCLVGLLALIAWPFLPKSEDALFEKARVLMESDSTLDWDLANKQYLSVLQEKFPNGKHADQVQQYIDKIEMHKAEERLKMSNRIGREPKTEGERLYSQARQYEQFGDRVSAVERYDAMIKLLENDREARPYVNLARRQKAQIESAGGHEDRLKIIGDALARAEATYQAGNVVEARKIWTSIVSLYDQNRECKPLVQRARKRLSNDKDDTEPDSEVASEAPPGQSQ